MCRSRLRGGRLGSRAAYYEEAGALRDMIQNHMLQLLSRGDGTTIFSGAGRCPKRQDGSVTLLRPIIGADVEQFTVRAQYTEGIANGKPVKGYRLEKGVARIQRRKPSWRSNVSSRTGAGRAYHSIWTGKALPRRASEIAVQFKDIPQILFNADPHQPSPPMSWLLRIQPEEGLSLRIVSTGSRHPNSNPSGRDGFPIQQGVRSSFARSL